MLIFLAGKVCSKCSMTCGIKNTTNCRQREARASGEKIYHLKHKETVSFLQVTQISKNE